ncbi:hypothetical protein H8K32_03620 [Undibacterium jejuense]|uniref:Uncharacterized protein n=1 Tax=Undibacterium jejuense TaxID=1344949 RepID=A0A923KMS7_9BURK|nr:hypothetical protein [Undibacterium jejuense]MBC3861178.1 hypothetical protein [Undibacterium jejuense]
MNHTKSASQQARFPWNSYGNSQSNAVNSTPNFRNNNKSNVVGPNVAAPNVTAVAYRVKRHTIQQDFMMRITIDSDSASQFRHLILNTCGEQVTFMRMQAIEHASRLKVWLCLSKPIADEIIHAIVSTLPNAEFGRMTPLNTALRH